MLAKHPDLIADLPPLGEALRDDAEVSYTQWEAWLALYHASAVHRQGRRQSRARTEICADRRLARRAGRASGAAQGDRALSRLRIHRPGRSRQVCSASAILDLLVKAGLAKPPRRPKNLPFASLGSLFKGREEDLDKLHKALNADAGGATAIVGRALHGLGGIGKTRLAVEYAWQHESEHSALLFVRAEAPATLDTSLAALAGPAVLDLPEKDAREDAAKIAAALRLARGPSRLADDPRQRRRSAAVAAVDRLLARLSGGKVVVTGRAGNFPAACASSNSECSLGQSPSLPAGAHDEDRAQSPDDAKLAQELAGELDGLALGLEQAGAYIATERIGFARYLEAMARQARDLSTGSTRR